MKKTIAIYALALAVGLLTFSTTARAEEQDASKPEWDGAYIGAVFGKSNLKSTVTDVTGLSVYSGYEHDFDDSGTVGGFLAGYNWSFGNWVTGIEADYSFGNLHASSIEFDSVQFDQRVESKIHWLSTLRGRAGYSFGRFMPYLTGGLAYADVTDKETDYDGGAYDAHDSYISRKKRFGWALGTGAECLLSESWMLRFEGMYIDLGAVENRATTDVYKQRSTLTTLRLGLLYHF